MNRTEFEDRLLSAIEVLKTLSPQQFYDEKYDEYHPVRKEIAILIQSLEIDPAVLAAFLQKHPQNDGWLPENPHELSSMSVIDVHSRLISNVSGDRWVDGALFKPFQSGSLTKALEILFENLSELASHTVQITDKDKRDSPGSRNDALLDDARELVTNRRWAAEILMQNPKGHFLPLNTLVAFDSDQRGIIHVCWATLMFRDDYIYITVYDIETLDFRHALVRVKK
ncbi:hypothetical protein AB4Y96_09345 [Phyllobacterium sp. TAF24]|uniref:hypothetical protein n=1 Tax=Phyllobacterium sp. TAF24 TaxID=3233068 RepID=UPI003F9C1F98